MEPLDQDVVNIAKAIRQTESGGNFNAKGKSGEYGAYQFTEPTWNIQAKKYGINSSLKDATPEEQNQVAYRQLKEWKDKGYNVGQVASMWNAGEGEPDAYTGQFSNGRPSSGTNKFGAKYDVPAYAKSVASAYKTIKGGGEVYNDPNNPSSTSSSNDEPIKDKVFGEGSSQPLNADENFLTSLVPGYKLAQGVGYSIGGREAQKNLGQSQNDAMNIQSHLLQRIREKKNRGEDTSRLEAALHDIGENIDTVGNEMSDAGTGGITNKQVLASAGKLALLPALAYANGALSGGGVSNTAKGLETGKLFTNNPFKNSAVSSIIKERFGAEGLASRRATSGEIAKTLRKSLEEMSYKEAQGSKGKAVLRALQEIEGQTANKQGLLPKLAKGAWNTGKNYLMLKLLGDKIGGALHKLTD